MNFISKNINNASSVTSNSGYINSVAVNNIVENATSVSANTTTSPYYPYTLDYHLGSVFTIPSNYTTSANFSVILKNIPCDTGKTYAFTLLYYQPTNLVYCNQVRASDEMGSYILGTSSTFGTPLFNGGSSNISITTAPNLIAQSFYIVSIPTTSNTYSRYIISNVANNT